MPFYLLPTLSTRDDDDGNFCSILRIVYYHQRWIFKLDFLVVACRDSRTKWNRNVRQQLWQRALILRSDSKLSYRGVSIRPVREIDAVFFCSLISSQSAALSWLLISISKKSEDALGNHFCFSICASGTKCLFFYCNYTLKELWKWKSENCGWRNKSGTAKANGYAASYLAYHSPFFCFKSDYDIELRRPRRVFRAHHFDIAL